MAYQTINPATGELVRTFPGTTDAEVDVALDRAQTAYEGWRDTPVALVRRRETGCHHGLWQSIALEIRVQVGAGRYERTMQQKRFRLRAFVTLLGTLDLKTRRCAQRLVALRPLGGALDSRDGRMTEASSKETDMKSGKSHFRRLRHDDIDV